MSSKAPRINFKLSFFTIGDHYELVEYDENDVKLKETWGSYYNYIKKNIKNDVFSKLVIDENKDIDHLDGKPIQVLFLESAQLSGNALLDKLAENQLAKFRIAEFNSEKIGTFAPMITIGTFDIMPLYSYPFEEEMQADRESRMLRDLRLDTRYKFLDSSIWFRYIPIKPKFVQQDKKENVAPKNSDGPSKEDTLFERFKKLLEEICNYWIDGLYFTKAALATLDLQLRLLQQSRLNDKIGQGGHAEAVTPFKFHSESFLQDRAHNEIEFFTKERGKNHTNNGVSISSECKLRVLIVDDQGKALSTIGGKKYEGKAVGKKDLIMKPLCDIFANMNKEEADFPDQESGIIKFCLEKLEKNSFDLIFLDYLLGKRKDDASTREYGHEFLLNLLNDSRSESSNFKRSFQGKFWIFSISSFPFALPDKLHQLGISHLQNLWHLSYGGDPVTTPHLYKYYLLRFVKQKVSSYFLHPDLLLRILKENPIKIEDGSERFWAEYLENTINNWQRHIDLASRYTQSSQQWTFVDNIAWFCKQNFALNYLLETILHITGLMRDGYVGGRKILRHVQELKRVELLDYEKVVNRLIEDLKKFDEIYENKQSSKIELDSNAFRLRLSNLKLYSIPKTLLNKKKTIRELYLDNNQFENFPKDLFRFQNLNRLHLNNNPIQSIEGDINTFPLLTELNLSGTPIAEFLKIPHAQSRSEVLELWRETQSLQVSSTTPKVLYFGLSPSELAQLRIDKEFKAIKIALKGERFELAPNFAISYLDFQREILRENANVIHFAGHGNEDSLVFQDSSVSFSTVINDFFSIPEVYAHIQCIVLNACHTGNQAKDLSKFGLYVIGIDGALEDDYAIEFSSGFYNATTFIAKNDFGTAFRIGINATKSKDPTKNVLNNKNNAKSKDTASRDTGGFESKIMNNIKLWYNGVEIKITDEKRTDE